MVVGLELSVVGVVRKELGVKVIKLIVFLVERIRKLKAGELWLLDVSVRISEKKDLGGEI